MPQPRDGETRSEFVSRCIPIVLEDGTADDQDQAIAVCSSMWEDRGKAVIKKEADGNHPSSHYLVVEDPEKPTTWHLRVKGPDGRPDHRLMGAAWAALHGGYRGSKYEGPQKQAAIEKLRKLYRREDMDTPGKATNELKAVSKTDDELRVGNYAIVFGGRDLEGIASPRKNQDGSTGEFFTPKTALESDYTATGRLYVDWEHGRDPDPESPGRDEVLGFVDWGTAKADDRGLWVERVLSRRNAYMKWLEALVDEGLIGNSTEPVQSQVQKGEDGEIKAWPLKRDTLTVTPMEPRMLSDNALVAMKALAQEFPHVDSLAKAVAGLEAGAEEGQTEEPSPDATARQTVDVNININVADKATPEAASEPQEPAEEALTQEDDNMSEEKNTEQAAAPEPVDVAAIAKEAAQVAAKAAAEEAVKAFQKRLEETEQNTSAGVVTITKGRADNALEGNPYKSLGEFLGEVAQAGAHGIMSERLMPLRSGDPLDENGFDLGKALGPKAVGGLLYAKAAGMSETVPADGGFLVATDRQAGIMSRVYDVGQLLQRVAMFRVSAGANGMTFYADAETSRVDGSRRGGVRAYWTAEASDKTSSSPTFREMELRLRKVAALVYSTDELLQDTTALESYVMRILPEELRFVVEDAFINGTGAGQPAGILSSGALVSVAKETGQAATTFVAENAIKMWARLWGPSKRNAVWLINQDVEPQLMQMSLAVGTGGQLVYMPPGGLSGAPYGTLFGRPVLYSEYQPTLGTVGDVLLADLSQYYAIEKGGVESASSIHVRFTYDETAFRFVYRVDGQSSWNSALTPNAGSNTVSPFVVVATRA